MKQSLKFMIVPLAATIISTGFQGCLPLLITADSATGGGEFYVSLKDGAKIRGEMVAVRDSLLIIDTLQRAWISDASGHFKGLSVLAISEIDTITLLGKSNVAKSVLLGTGFGTLLGIGGGLLTEPSVKTSIPVGAIFFGGPGEFKRIPPTEHEKREWFLTWTSIGIFSGFFSGLVYGVSTSSPDRKFERISAESARELKKYSMFLGKEPSFLKTLR